jgi:glycine C-acetyltransferase
MYGKLQQHLENELNDIESAGLMKQERQITTAQGSNIGVVDGREVLNLCANNYLGLAQHP